MPVGSGAYDPLACATGAQSDSHWVRFHSPARRTGRADFPHPALQWDHASRTRNASSEPLPAIAGHSRCRWLCVPPAPRSCTASPAIAPLRRAAKPVYALTAPSLQSVSPAPSLTHVMLRNSLPLHAGFIGKATPAGLRPSVIPPHLRPLSSTGITPRLQSYRPLRHPAGPACPSRGSRLPRARHRQGFPCCYAFHLPCMPTPLPRRKTDRCSRRSLPSRPTAFP